MSKDYDWRIERNYRDLDFMTLARRLSDLSREDGNPRADQAGMLIRDIGIWLDNTILLLMADDADKAGEGPGIEQETFSGSNC